MKSINFSSRCPKTGFRAFAENPVAKSLLLLQFGGQKMPPQRASIPNRLTAWTVPQFATDPKEHSNLLSGPTNPDAPTGNPFDALISMSAQHVLG
jgi:hypothetical protein